MQPKGYLRTAAFLALGLAAGIGVLGFRETTSGDGRAGLEDYRPEAIEAIDPTRTGDMSKAPNSEIVTILESRHVCRELYFYVRDAKADPDALEARLRQGGTRAKENGPGPSFESSANIDQFVEFAVRRIEEGRKAGSTAPVADLLKTECSNIKDPTQPILTSDG